MSATKQIKKLAEFRKKLDIESSSNEEVENAFNDLVKLDPRFSSFQLLFPSSLSSSFVNRKLQNKEFNDKLNIQLEMVLHLLTGVMKEDCAQQILQFLLRIYYINEINPEILLRCILPFFQTPFFYQIISTVDLREFPLFFFLYESFKKAMPTLSMVTSACISNEAFLIYICESFITFGKSPFIHTSVLAFYASVIADVIVEKKEMTDSVLRVIIPFICSTISSTFSEMSGIPLVNLMEMEKSSLMITTLVGRHCRLSNAMACALLHSIVVSACRLESEKYEQFASRLITAACLVETQGQILEISFPPALPKMMVKETADAPLLPTLPHETADVLLQSLCGVNSDVLEDDKNNKLFLSLELFDRICEKYPLFDSFLYYLFSYIHYSWPKYIDVLKAVCGLKTIRKKKKGELTKQDVSTNVFSSLLLHCPGLVYVFVRIVLHGLEGYTLPLENYYVGIITKLERKKLKCEKKNLENKKVENVLNESKETNLLLGHTEVGQAKNLENKKIEEILNELKETNKLLLVHTEVRQAMGKCLLVLYSANQKTTQQALDAHMSTSMFNSPETPNDFSSLGSLSLSKV
jgi:hypothetical protein